MGSVSYYMIGLNANIYVFMKFLMVLVLNLVAAAVCLCFATAFKSVATANLLANLTILFSMLFGGFLLNKGKHIFLSYVAHHSNFSVLCLDHIPPVLR
jgi:drug/metabolite transporter (DMT)-like permease